VVGLIPEGLRGLDVSWGEEEEGFVGHRNKLHTVLVPFFPFLNHMIIVLRYKILYAARAMA